MRGGFNTRAVQSGELRDKRIGTVVTPVFQASTFMYPNPEPGALVDKIRGEPFIYTRWNNPTTQALEEKYASLENASHALAFSSGMGAISTTVLALARRNRKILSVAELYGQTYGLFKNVLTNFGIETTFISIDQLNKGEFDPRGFDLVYTESIINPTLKVSDIMKASEITSEAGIPLVVDATFASPYNQNPLDLGAAVVVHSATKYIAGHSDTIYGLAGTNSKEYFDAMQEMRRMLGSTPDPYQSFLVMRGVKTLGLRMERHNENSTRIARFLEGNRRIAGVFHPSLENSKYHSVGRKNLRGPGGMVSFEVSGGVDAARSFMRALRIPVVASSLGGVESLVTLPIETSHRSISRELRLSLGIRDELVRFSCGIEDSQDLIDDISQALESI
ncbi:MAG TPA: PLP-dependent transferase [Thermoplasmataceae archaeon]|nr:PLP-dependent transferase [Thermoplasmataceae archaeon]